MFTNQDFGHINEALSLKSVLQDVSARAANVPVSSASNSIREITVRDIDSITGQVLPTKGQTVHVGFLPKPDQVVAIKDPQGEMVYGRVVVPDTPNDAPYIKRLSKEEAASLAGTRHAVEIIHASTKILGEPPKAKPIIKLPVFLEPGERLIFSIYNRMLKAGSREFSTRVYIIELLLILTLALMAIVVMWIYALA